VAAISRHRKLDRGAVRLAATAPAGRGGLQAPRQGPVLLAAGHSVVGFSGGASRMITVNLASSTEQRSATSAGSVWQCGQIFMVEEREGWAPNSDCVHEVGQPAFPGWFQIRRRAPAGAMDPGSFRELLASPWIG
jgi:hypothetical protein